MKKKLKQTDKRVVEHPLEYYGTVEMALIEGLWTCAENDELYGKIDPDTASMVELRESIRNGLETPLIVSKDNVVLSGNRRLAACTALGLERVPVFRSEFVYDDATSDEVKTMLARYNEYREKTVVTLVREALSRVGNKRSHDPDEYEPPEIVPRVDRIISSTERRKHRISEGKQEFLQAVIKVLKDGKQYLPYTVRTIHYRLLNSPPLKLTYKGGQINEKKRYRNDQESYSNLSKLVTDARFLGLISHDAIEDTTRSSEVKWGYRDREHFLDREFRDLLRGYRRSPQTDQPYHIEVLAEKNTVMRIIKPVADEFFVPWSISRGYGSVSLWSKIANRFHASGKDEMKLIVLSDFDPEGLNLAEVAINTLKTEFGLPITGFRAGITLDQVADYGLEDRHATAKRTSSRFKKFVAQTGSKNVWELEALEPKDLQRELRDAIHGCMDLDIYAESQRQYERDLEELSAVRRDLFLAAG